jgi:hypothetical protein
MRPESFFLREAQHMIPQTMPWRGLGASAAQFQPNSLMHKG